METSKRLTYLFFSKYYTNSHHNKYNNNNNNNKNSSNNRNFNSPLPHPPPNLLSTGPLLSKPTLTATTTETYSTATTMKTSTATTTTAAPIKKSRRCTSYGRLKLFVIHLIICVNFLVKGSDRLCKVVELSM